MNPKQNEETMFYALGSLLTEGETIESAVFCVYKPTGFWASSRNIISGYVGITDRDRLIGFKMGLLDQSSFGIDMKHLKKIKISKRLFGQKEIDLVFLNEKKFEVKFQTALKIYGNQFPNQESNLRILLERLGEKQAMLTG